MFFSNDYFFRQTRLDVPRGSPVNLHAVPAGAGQAVEVRPKGLHFFLLHEEYETALYSDAVKQRIVKRAKDKIEEAMEEEGLEREVGTCWAGSC